MTKPRVKALTNLKSKNTHGLVSAVEPKDMRSKCRTCNAAEQNDVLSSSLNYMNFYRFLMEGHASPMCAPTSVQHILLERHTIIFSENIVSPLIK
ncbi:hypothetical protein NPIL_673561 [Nephila pilipes]|uniref:Uncharacterized protein n=1 Tax=Nephila pilipes TaxID=299642 RepID=A0A8X6JCT7_NEPPI|nr:hypothetical protein NPIL_673561 [Nephila pilipes]